METQIHGALVEVHGLGVLLTGRSGVGKSECVLELVQGGHRLVADDVVKLRRVEPPPGRPRASAHLVGTSPEAIRHYLEIRGIGLLYVPDLYGKDSVREEHRVDLVCRMEKWQQDVNYERIGIERPMIELAGVAVPTLTIPIRPATSSATLVDVASRDELQRLAGNNAAKRLDESLQKKSEPS